MTRTPRIESNGVPFCSRNDCPMYDGKRCREIGFFIPDIICGPEVAAMAADLRALRATPTPRSQVAAQWVSRGLRCPFGASCDRVDTCRLWHAVPGNGHAFEPPRNWPPSADDPAPSREPDDAGGGP